MCETCDGTGLKVEKREGTRYAYSCKDCAEGARISEKELRLTERNQLARQRGSPLAVVE